MTTENVLPHAKAVTPRRTFLHLVLCVAIARGIAMGNVWSLGRRQRRALEYVEAAWDSERILAQVRILLPWLRRCKRRKRYAPREWQFILEYGDRWRRTGADLARDIGVSPATACRQRKRWRDAGRFIIEFPKPKAPCRRIADNRRAFVLAMVHAGFRHDLTISRHLALQGERISPRSVARFRREGTNAPIQIVRRCSDRPPDPLSKDPRDAVDIASAYVVGSEQLARPRVARLLRVLSDAFTEGVASANLRMLDAEESDAAFDTKLKDVKLRRSRLSEQLAIIRARLSRIPPQNRHRFSAAERAGIMTVKHLHRLSNDTTAKWFLIDRGTLSHWNRDVDDPEKRKRPLVEPLADLEAAIAELFPLLPRVPKRLRPEIEQTLTELAGKVPKRRYRTRKAKAASAADAHAPAAKSRKKRPTSPICPEYRNHYWGSDITVIRIGRSYFLLAVVDLYSRDILAWGLFAQEPSSEDVTGLFHQALARHGQPKHFLTDQGAQFLGESLQNLIASLTTDHRLGAVGEHGSIAIQERLWRTTKEHLDLNTVRPEVSAILRERVAVVVDYYRTKRPHSALGNATPAEVYSGIPSRAADAKPAPRGWRGEEAAPPPFVIRHAFPDERKLPYLERVA